jgi:signal transduction histidine kinase
MLRRSAQSAERRLKDLMEAMEARHRQEPAWALTKIDQALRDADTIGDRAARMEILLIAGRANARQGQLGLAEPLLLEARDTAVQLGQQNEALCRIYTTLGAVCFMAGKNMLALEHYDRALSCGVAEHKVTIYTNLANLYFTIGNYDKSLQYQHKALRLAEMRGSVEHQVYCLSNIGAVCVRLDRLDDARANFEQALALVHQHGGDAYMRCSLLLNVGEVLAKDGDTEQALEQYQKALQHAREQRLSNEQARAHLAIGQILEAQGQEHRFLHHVYRSRKLAERTEQDAIQNEALEALERYFKKRGDFKKAYGYLEERNRLSAEKQVQRHVNELSQQLDAKEAALCMLEEQKSQIEQQKQDLERYTLELERTNKDLEQFANVVAHDLQEPLRSISGFSSLLERRFGGNLDDTGKGYMKHLVNSSKRMHALLTELLHYNTISHRPKQEIAEVDAEMVVQEVLHSMGNLVREKEAQVMIGKLPRLRIPHEHLLEIFRNLIENALKHAEDGPCKIRIRCRLQGQHFRFEVKDNGPGIAEQYHDKIFALFYRHERRENQGTGIGLALCRRIVHLYDGNIGVESQPGEGASFWFKLRI